MTFESIRPYIELAPASALIDLPSYPVVDNKVELGGTGLMRVGESSVVCYSPHSSFHAGSAVELLVWHKRTRGVSTIQTFTEVLQYLRQRVLHLTEAPEYREIEQLAETYIAYRQVFDIMTDADPHTVCLATTKALRYVQNQEIDLKIDRHTLIPLGPRRMQELVSALKVLGHDLQWPAGQAGIVTPYFYLPHAWDKLVVRRADGSNPRLISIATNSISYTGLWRAHTDRPWLVFASAEEAAKTGTGLQGRQFCTAALTDISSSTPYREGRQTLILTDDLQAVTNIGRVLSQNGGWPQMRTIHQLFSPQLTGDKNTLDVVLEELRALTVNDQLPVSAVQLLEAQGPDPQFKGRVESMLQNLGRYKSLQVLNQRFGQGSLFSTTKSEVLVTSSGYVSRARDTGENMALTNFTWTPESRVSFPESVGSYIRLKIDVGAGERQLLIPEHMLETGKKLADHLLNTENKPDVRPARVLAPDKAGPLLHWTRKNLADLEQQYGLSFMGFSGLRNHFWHPDFYVGEGVLDNGVVPWHPDTRELQCFQSGLVEPHLHQDLTPDLADLVAMILGLVGRWHQSWAVEPIRVLHTSWNTRVIERVFRGLGQVQPISWGQNARNTQTSGVRGYPVYTKGMKDAQLKDLANPIVALTDKGLSFARGKYETLDRAAQTLNALLRMAVPALTRGESWVQEPARRACYESSLIEEGQQIVRKCSDLSNWPASQRPYEVLESVLSQVKAEDVERFFLWDIRRGRMVIDLRKLPKKVGIRTQDLVMELTDLAGDVLLEGQMITTGVEGQRFICNYYGAGVKPGIWEEPEEPALKSKTR